MLCVQRKRQADVKKQTPIVMKWHSNLRDKLIKPGSGKPTYDKKWGRFPPKKRINVFGLGINWCGLTRDYETSLLSQRFV